MPARPSGATPAVLSVALRSVMCGHSADCAFGEVFSFDSEGVIKAGSVVFPCNYGGQLDEFGFVESFAQAREECVGNLDWCSRHRIRIFQDEPLDR